MCNPKQNGHESYHQYGILQGYVPPSQEHLLQIVAQFVQDADWDGWLDHHSPGTPDYRSLRGRSFLLVGGCSILGG